MIIFCGIPGSGKTTIAKLVASEIGSAVHVQGDVIRLMIPRPAYSGREARFVYESIFSVGRQALRSGQDAILDATFLREDYRRQAERRLAGYYSSSTVVCVLCDREVARARNSLRDMVVPEASFDRLTRTFQKPRRAIFVNSERQTPESAAEYVLRELERLDASGGIDRTEPYSDASASNTA